MKLLIVFWLDAQRSLTQAGAVTREPVAVAAGAVETSHGVTALVLTASVRFAALVHICQSQTHSAASANQVELKRLSVTLSCEPRVKTSGRS